MFARSRGEISRRDLAIIEDSSPRGSALQQPASALTATTTMPSLENESSTHVVMAMLSTGGGSSTSLPDVRAAGEQEDERWAMS